MATIHVELSTVSARARTGATLPIPNSVEIDSDTVTSSGSSAVSTLTGGLGQVWTVTALDGPVWLKFGTGTPIAAAEDGRLLLEGDSRDYAVTTASEKLAIKDV